jgi:transcriptional regulator with XRE-family HTH domain
MGGDAVFVISSIGKKLFDKLRRKSYRASYVAEHVRRGIAYQVRAIRDQRNWSQGHLSRLLEKPQSVVSRLEDPSYGKSTVQTLLEVAAVFDVALQVRFVPYSTFLQQTRNLSSESMRVLGFDDELRSQSEVRLKPLSEIFMTGDVPHIDFGSSGEAPKNILVTETPRTPELIVQ